MSSSREAGDRGLIDLPAARLADIRQPRDRLRLLICESESAARQSLVKGLLGLNVEVACSDDGARALLDVGRLSPDVLLIAADLSPARGSRSDKDGTGDIRQAHHRRSGAGSI